MNFSFDVVAGVIAIVGVIIWAVRLEVLIKTHDRELVDQKSRITIIDEQGSRAVGTVQQRIQSLETSSNKIVDSIEQNRNIMQEMLRKLDVISERQNAVLLRLEKVEEWAKAVSDKHLPPV